jgi:peptidoglycan/xylan/chitin deacetylase (PgdA/CDA1 family)
MAGTVCLTFDFDALSLWINRRQTSPASLSRGEFGAVAVPRILQLLNAYAIQSTWFIPGHTFEYLRDASGSVLPGLRPAEEVFRNWTDDLVYMLRDFDDGVAVVTFHPQVIGRGHRLLALERWVDELVKMGVAFARCGDVARQVLAGRAYGTYRPSADRQ